MKTRITALLGIEHPIFQAAMSWASSSAPLVVAVSEAGGMGVLAAGPMRPEEREGGPLPQADAELAPVAQLRAPREQVRHLVQPVGKELADHPSSKNGVSPSPRSRMSKR